MGDVTDDRYGPLLEKIEEDLLDENTPLDGTLLKCVALSGYTRSASLRELAKSELSGHQPTQEVPHYRWVSANLWIEHTDGKDSIVEQLNVALLPPLRQLSMPNGAVLRESVRELENFSRSDAVLIISNFYLEVIAGSLTMDLQRSGDLREDRRISRIYWMVEPEQAAVIVQRIRTALLVFIAELKSSTSSDREVPTAEETDTALEKAIPGIINVTAHSGATVNVNHSSEDASSRARFWHVVGWILAFAVAIVGAYAGLGQWLQWPAPWK